MIKYTTITHDVMVVWLYDHVGDLYNKYTLLKLLLSKGFPEYHYIASTSSFDWLVGISRDTN